MSSGKGQSAEGGCEDTEQSLWKCPLCLDTLRSPKLLPCSHTFCMKCLDDLLRHSKGRSYSSSSSFPCPSCRETIQVPRGGVTAFKTNFYLEAARDPSVTHREMLCTVHTSRQRELELFCHQCHVPICLQCKMEEHADHPTQEVGEVTATVKTKLKEDLRGLAGTMDSVRAKVKAFSQERRAVLDKQAALERDIRDRHLLMIRNADTCRDDALFSLDTATASICSQLDAEAQGLDSTLDSLDKLKKRMDSLLQGDGEEEGGSRLLVTARDCYRDADALDLDVKRMLAKRITTVSRPVLRHADVTADVTLTTQRKFVGSAERMDMAANEINVKVKQLFRCAPVKNQTSEVYFVCPLTSGNVWVVFDKGCDGSSGRSPQMMSYTGEVQKIDSSFQGKATLLQSKHGLMFSKQTQGAYGTHAKAGRLVKLKNNLDGTGSISEIEPQNGGTSTVFFKRVCSIHCGPHRAFDVDENRAVFAVVTEARPEQRWRQVHIYRKPQSDPLATYASPVQPYQPSDVCFYRIAGYEVLLVADELNDAIHVVRLNDGQPQFAAYLAAGSPLIMQPTALNADLQGRLFVGCRSGAVLLCEPA